LWVASAIVSVMMQIWQLVIPLSLCLVIRLLDLEDVSPVDRPPFVVVGLGFAEEAIAASWVHLITAARTFVAVAVRDIFVDVYAMQKCCHVLSSP